MNSIGIALENRPWLLTIQKTESSRECPTLWLFGSCRKGYQGSASTTSILFLAWLFCAIWFRAGAPHPVANFLISEEVSHIPQPVDVKFQPFQLSMPMTPSNSHREVPTLYTKTQENCAVILALSEASFVNSGNMFNLDLSFLICKMK